MDKNHIGHHDSVLVQQSQREDNDIESVNMRMASLLKQKDEEVEYLKHRLEENTELVQEVENLANMLQKTQETLKKLAAENGQLKQYVSSYDL